MKKSIIVLWFLFPFLGLISWVMFAGTYLGYWDKLYEVTIFNPITTIFYLGSVLYTIPNNMFTFVAIFVGIKKIRNNDLIGKYYIIAGVGNFVVSVLWAYSVYRLNWIITA